METSRFLLPAAATGGVTTSLYCRPAAACLLAAAALLLAGGPISADDSAGSRTFTLRVVDSEGEPVPEAQVEVRRSQSAETWSVHAGTLLRKLRYGTLFTADESGVLSFDLPDPQGSLALNISTAGYAPFWAQWDQNEKSEQIPDGYTVKLASAYSIGGVVVDPDGKPVEGVEVHPSIEYMKRDGDQSQLGVGTRIRTDANGVWHYHCAPASEEHLRLSLSHPGFAPLRINPTTAELRCGPEEPPTYRTMLDPGLVITGRIVNAEGKPVPKSRSSTKCERPAAMQRGPTGWSAAWRVR